MSGLNTDTKLYCIFGNPVGHSKSPLVHNACFQKYQHNAVYLAFEIKRIKKGIEAIRALNMQGASITIPFKEQIIPYLDKIDNDAHKIGAVNTIVNKNGMLKGYNTDLNAAVSPLKPFGIEDKKVCIIGAGGAARAIAHGITKQKGKLIVVNRNRTRGKNLASANSAEFISYNALQNMPSLDADILINTTSVGMVPDIQHSPVPDRLINPEMIVMDIVYTPINTKLLTTAKKKGCHTIDGLTMFLEQASAQFKLWTTILPEINFLKQLLVRTL